jgi:hypothetical protein
MSRVSNQRGRKGVVPEEAIYIGRGCNHKSRRLWQSKWHNRFKVGRDGTLEEVLIKYEQDLYERGLINNIHELRGCDLACWCAPAPCQGDVLLRLANE